MVKRFFKKVYKGVRFSKRRLVAFALLVIVGSYSGSYFYAVVCGVLAGLSLTYGVVSSSSRKRPAKRRAF